MNKNEIIGYNYLLSLGYKENNITFHKMMSPDFVTSDGKGWEVKVKPKRCSGIKHIFTPKQFSLPDNTEIIFVDGKEVIESINFKDCCHLYKIVPKIHLTKKTYKLYLANEQFRLTLPKVLVQSANLRAGDEVELLIEHGDIIIRKVI